MIHSVKKKKPGIDIYICATEYGCEVRNNYYKSMNVHKLMSVKVSAAASVQVQFTKKIHCVKRIVCQRDNSDLGAVAVSLHTHLGVALRDGRPSLHQKSGHLEVSAGEGVVKRSHSFT